MDKESLFTKTEIFNTKANGKTETTTAKESFIINMARENSKVASKKED
jgi:hypothetical protein